jgi:predicted transcriptional regulator of viral defense system
MKHKNISFQSNAILEHFLRSNQLCFTSMEALGVLSKVSQGTVRELLSDMTKRGLLMRIKKGLYYIIPFEQDPETFIPDWHLLVAHLVNGNRYYIGYYSALQLHQLITQPSLNELIVTDHQIKPSTIKVRDITFQFIYHNEKHFFGSKKIWIDSFNKVIGSDLEKTFVDCLFQPDYAGGIVEVGKSLYMARAIIDFRKLLDYCKKFGSQAVIKRLGFLLELFKIDTSIIKDLQDLKTSSYILLDTEMAKKGKKINRWSIQQNIDSETIQSSILS